MPPDPSTTQGLPSGPERLPAPASPASESPASDVEPRYTLLVEVDRGGMGKILLARDNDLKRDVAMKLLLAEPTDGEPLRRFVAEAQVTAQLEHPNIVPVYGRGRLPSGEPFFTMKFVMGRTFKEILSVPKGAASDWSFIEMLQIFQSVCNAVHFAHSKGIVHRDLKPENIRVGDYGEVLVMDWGLAKRIGSAEDRREGEREVQKGLEELAPHLEGMKARHFRTLEGTVVGTPAYMAPEQARGEMARIGPAADVYALGAILYEMLTCRPPFSGKTNADIIRKVAGQEPPRPRELDPEISPELEAICLKAMHRDPEGRYAAARELRDDVQAYIEGRAVAAIPRTRWGRLRKGLHRRRNPLLAGGLLVLAVGGLLGWFTRELHRRQMEIRGAKEGKAGLEGDLQTERKRAEAERKARLLIEKARLAQEASADPKEALAFLAAARAADPGLPDVELEEGRLLARLGRTGEALERFTSGLRQAPDSIPLLRARRRLLSALGRKEGADADRSRLMTLDPEGEEALCQRGVALIFQEAYGPAAEALTRSLALEPVNPEARYWRGIAHARLQRPADAVGDLSAAISAGYVPEGVYAERGKCLTQLGRFDEAIADLDRHLSSAPDDWGALQARAQAKNGRRDAAGALADFSEAIEKAPTLPAPYLGRAQFFAQRRQWREAIEDARAALRLQPRSTGAWTMLCALLLEAGDPEEAAVQFRQLQRAYPRWKHDARARFLMGRIALARGEREKARQEFQAALQIEPNNAEIRAALESLEK